ncbi:MAG: class I SAM-dependent methyltransferase, partial [Verrucomicrobiales bacterium]
LDIERGMTVADIGAGTGLYLKPFAEAVGDGGKLYAVDISEVFIKHLQMRSEKQGLKQVETILGAEDAVRLPDSSIDLAFICDTYHHFEYPKNSLASILNALKPGGRLALIDFERIPEVSREWTMGHVRAGKDVFTKEIETAGFEKVKELTLAGFKENYFIIFRKPK